VKSVYICGLDDWSELIYLAVCNFNFRIEGFVDLENTGVEKKFGVKVVSIDIALRNGESGSVFLANYEVKHFFSQDSLNNGKKFDIVFF